MTENEKKLEAKVPCKNNLNMESSAVTNKNARRDIHSDTTPNQEIVVVWSLQKSDKETRLCVEIVYYQESPKIG